jgi:DNA-binding transcriptional LysR family regulator
MVNLARFDFVSVRLAVACAQTGSLTGAARASHLALAAASRRIRELEEAMGCILFERHSRGLQVTAAGRLFVQHGLTLLQAMDRIGVELSDLRQGITRHVRLAASTAAISQFLPPLLAGYAKAHPEVRVELSEQVSREVLAMLRERRADVGIFVEGADIAGLQTQLFREDELVVVLPRGHAAAPGRARCLAFPRLLDEDWIGLNDGAAVLQTQQQAALAAGRPLATAHAGAQLRRRLPHGGLGPRADGAAAAAATLPIVRAMKLVTCRLTDPWARRRLLLATVPDSADAGVLQLLAFLAAPSQMRRRLGADGNSRRGPARPDCAAMDTPNASTPAGPLAGLKVGQLIAGPFAARRWATSAPT